MIRKIGLLLLMLVEALLLVGLYRESGIFAAAAFALILLILEAHRSRLKDCASIIVGLAGRMRELGAMRGIRKKKKS